MYRRRICALPLLWGVRHSLVATELCCSFRPRNKVTARAKQISSKASQHTTASGVAHTNRETETEHGGHRAETSSYSRDGVKAGTDDVTVAEVYGFVGWVATGLAYGTHGAG